ncbi:IMC sub-compartment protein ISP1 [Cardiosporidium cionae]|uniref:IMC sub-compartment protein ISP1 n=1 Tax=Cardiosporidium cionae TaxID=476202 RepID=A0ABQ7JFB0_9APIC|nr:IMC sub-compartment protein ISP1 [Cardiosporidium cionae]|eukprot:KAF8822570.1 IMC sub-compartment protein ISP1 [Cardiosporidium cionae]
MGGLSSCCSVEEAKDKVIVSEGSPTLTTMAAGTIMILENAAIAPAEDVNVFKARLQKGIGILVLLQDGTKLPCILCLNLTERAISISCDDKVRVIPISDIRQLLETKEQLWRVETKANLIEDPKCIALHLAESGNCIPIRFDSDGEKQNFASIIHAMKSAH